MNCSPPSWGVPNARRFAGGIPVLCVICFFAAACANVNLDENLADYDEEVRRLDGILQADSLAVDALRDLGAIYMRTGFPERASKYLESAYRTGSQDPKTLFYLGLVKESTGDMQEALRLYRSYAGVSRLSPYRRLMEGRYVWLVRDAAYQEMRQRLVEEASISEDDVSPEIVAVFPLTYLGGDDQYAPLGRGLAEMLSVDLQHVDQLRVVERVRLAVLLDELALTEAEYVDPSTAPRLGRLLRAGQIVGGSYNLLSGQNLRLDAAMVETVTAERRDLSSQSDALDNFFRLEKRIVFELIDELGIELTEAEQTRIEVVPTQNLQAFLAYSRGLQREDQQDYEGAASYFEEAVALDPSFTLADAGSQRTEATSAAAGSGADLLSSAMQIEPFLGEQIDLMDNRLDNLGERVGSPLVPGTDSRKPAVEATVSGAEGLPDPPPPPGGN